MTEERSGRSPQIHPSRVPFDYWDDSMMELHVLNAEASAPTAQPESP
jgi:hypothetical protein